MSILVTVMLIFSITPEPPEVLEILKLALRWNQMHSYQGQAPDGDDTLQKAFDSRNSIVHINLPQIARPKTETMQYIVLFSHLTVQLPIKYLFQWKSVQAAILPSVELSQ